MPRNCFAFLKVVTASSLLGVALFAQLLRAQQAPSVFAAGSQIPHITQAIDDNSRITLQGNVHPLASAQFDRGQVPVNTSADRMLLVLQRSAEQEAALKQFLEDVQNPASPNYHKWLTPEEFGKLYGPADADIQTITGWLQQQGFSVSSVLKGRTAIEFSGTVGQVQKTFHTNIHRFVVNGEQHFANVSDPQIPAALAPVVKGLVSLNNFKPQPLVKTAGRMSLDPASHRATPLFNVPSNGGSGYFLAVTPGDLNTIYDVAPLQSAGTNGAGVTIGVVGDSNIDLSYVNNYRSVFGLPANTPNVIVDGNDPGITSDAIEAYLDVEIAGAVAPKATINFYTAADTNVAYGLDLALIRAIEDNQVQILNVSFGACEAALGTSGNQEINSLYEQAAASGMTVVVASGDSGSAGCDNPNTESSAKYGLGVSGFASTPYNVAVGGTDFYYTNTNTIFGTYWKNPSSTSPNNNSDYSSALSYIPEKVWNDSDPTGNQLTGSANISGGGGGASSCATLNSAGSACVAGYAKPSWQTGTGVPADKVRDIPDVSLFAADGLNYSTYAICAYSDDCPSGVNPNTLTSPLTFSGVGGTSAASPAMAGILALVVQKYGAQGVANAVLYPLAAQKPAAFHDITVGNNQVACTSGSPNCTATINGGTYLSGYSATTGYDLATGLGSVDANQLVSNWNTISFKSTTTTLSISPTTLSHGQSATFNVTVSGSGGTPSGDVAILTNSGTAEQGSQAYMSLPAGKNSTSATYGSLPGGTYSVTARYGGDGIFAASTSSPTTITVNPENSAIALYDVSSGNRTTQLSSGAYGTTIAVDVGVYPSAVAVPASLTSFLNTVTAPATGSVTVQDGTAVVGVFPLTSTGVASIVLSGLAPGSHSLVFSYSGDASYNASNTNSSPIAVTVSSAAPTVALASSAASISASGTLTLTAVVKANSVAIQPSGNITFYNGTTSLGTAQLTAGYDTNGAVISVANLSVSAGTKLAVGGNTLSAKFAGDTNYSAATSNTVSVTVTAAVPGTSSTQVAISTVDSNTLKLSATVTGSGGTTPTGSVTFYTAGTSLGSGTLSGSGGTATASATFQLSQTAQSLVIGSNTFIGQYTGDNSLGGSSASTSLRLTAGGLYQDYTFLPTPAATAVKAGSSATFSLALTPVNAYSGTVALACATPSGFPGTCSLSSSSVSLSGSSPQQVTVTIATTASTSAVHYKADPRWWLSGGVALAALFLFSIPARRRGWRNALGMVLFLVLLGGMTACGGGGSSSGGSGGGGGGGGTGGGGGGGGTGGSASTNSYNVVVTATATQVPDQGTVVHNTVLRVTIQ